MTMLRLYGVAVSDDDARTLIDLLLRVGRADDLSAAVMIEKGVERELHAVALTPGERDAILGVLDDPPDGLVELREGLLGITARE